MLHATLILLVGAATAGVDEATWSVDLESSGEDVAWYSPDTIRTDAADYGASLTITAVSVIVSYAGFEFGPTDATDQLPLTYYEWTTDGPCPTSFGVESVHEPPPPEPIAIAFDLETRLDSTGQCILSLENIVLGTVTMDLGWPFGEVTVQLETVIVEGELNLTASGSLCPEDTDANNTVDVNDMLAVIASWGPCAGCTADVTGDGVVDVNDVLAVIAAWGPC